MAWCPTLAHLPWRRLGLAALAPRCHRTASTFATTFPLGLTNASATDAHWATALDLAAPLLRRRDCTADFMDAARADAEALGGVSVQAHLVGASAACDNFLRSGEVHDRDETRAELQGVFEREGQLVLFQGGKNVGKSLLLRELAGAALTGRNGQARLLVHINARTCGTNLLAGFYHALLGAQREAAVVKQEGASRSPEDVKRGSRRLTELQRLWDALLRQAPGSKLPLLGLGTPPPPGPAALSNLAFIDCLLSAAAEAGRYLCLVIDEGNLALPSPPLLQGEAAALSSEQRRRLDDTQALLARLVELTKGYRCLNVLIATSEPAYPFRLHHGGFFKLHDFTGFIAAGEVPPAAMRALLRKWGLRQRLADVFLAYYGGHVHLASQALARLAARQDGFQCTSVAPSFSAARVAACLDGAVSARVLLQGMAGAGFAGLRSTSDPAAQLIAREDVGGCVDSHASVVGLPWAVRTAGGANMGMVPSSHFLRHVIAEQLSSSSSDRSGAAESS